MNATYHYAKNGQTHGPVQLDEIRNLVSNGTLARTDYVIPTGGQAWQTADEIVGPAPAPIPKPAPAPTPKPAAKSVPAPKPAAEKPKSDKGFRYKRDGQELGPVSYDEIRRLADDGKVRATDPVSEDGGPWKPAGRHRGVFAGRRCEVNGVSFLHPKEWWVSVTPAEENPEFMTLSVENKFVSMNLGIYPDAITPEKALRTLRTTVENNEKYKDVTFGKTTALVGGERAEGFEFQAKMMGIEFVGRMFAVALGSRTVTFMFQASDERFDSIRPVAELIRGSLTVAG